MPSKTFTFERDSTAAGFLGKHRPISMDAYNALVEAVDSRDWKMAELTDTDSDRPRFVLAYSNEDDYKVFKPKFVRQLLEKGIVVVEIETN